MREGASSGYFIISVFNPLLAPSRIALGSAD
jgi:hypothetical protein